MTTTGKRTTGDWTARVGLDTFTVTVVRERSTYVVTTSDGQEDEAYNAETARYAVASMLRTARDEMRETADDASKDELQEAIDMITSTQGGAAKVLALLRANGF